MYHPLLETCLAYPQQCPIDPRFDLATKRWTYKKDAIFEFLPTNMDNSGFLFSIDGVRKISKYEKAFMAQKLDEKNIGVVTKHKKVTFDEKVLNDTCKFKNNCKENSETEKAKEKLKKKKEKNVNTYHRTLGHPR